MAIRKSLILMAAIATQCFIAGAGHAKQIQVKLTQEQVKTTCGSLIVNAGSHFGCKKGCGDGKTCGFSCEKGGKNCKGVVVERAGASPGSGSGTPPSRVNQSLQGGILDRGSSGFGTQGPAATGTPMAPTAPAGGSGPARIN